MIKLLLISPDKDSFSGMDSALSRHNEVETEWAESGNRALELASDIAFDLVVVDENLGDMTGLEFAKRLLPVNPMINCAAVSPLEPKEFHEVSEGFGILMQLPLRPGEQEAEDLLERLGKILNLSAGK
ncbi:MAG: response regulator [Desulfobulbaceae bacterium]|nr:response regulator [Desulfobulbaceae bacterium]